MKFTKKLKLLMSTTHSKAWNNLFTPREWDKCLSLHKWMYTSSFSYTVISPAFDWFTDQVSDKHFGSKSLNILLYYIFFCLYVSYLKRIRAITTCCIVFILVEHFFCISYIDIFKQTPLFIHLSKMVHIMVWCSYLSVC